MGKALLLLCLVGVMSLAASGMPAELTVWQLESDSFPANLRWMSDGTLYVSVQNPIGIARFEPSANRLGVWTTTESPGEFEVVGNRIFFAQPYAGELVWFNLQYGMMAFHAIPSANAWPVMLLNGSDDPGAVEIWYLDWRNGNVGVFSPIESGPFDRRNIAKRVSLLAKTSYGVEPSIRQVIGATHLADPSLVPAVASVQSTENAPFTEWEMFSPDAPPFGFTHSDYGRIWISGATGEPLQELSPWTNTVTLHDLPGDPLVLGLAAAAGSQMWYLATDPATSIVSLGVLDTHSGNVMTWTIPDGSDPISLTVVGDEIWFTDRGTSSIYRFDPRTSSFAWWLTGADDAPMSLEPGADGEMWISFERTGGIARLVYE